MLKIKVKPEDFVVEEIADLPFQKDGDFCVYLLKKRGWNTVDILKMLSRKFSISYSYFSYGGKKDKYALTSQYITIARQGYKKNTPVSRPSQGDPFSVSAQSDDKRMMKNPRINRPDSQFYTKGKELTYDLISRHKYPVPAKVEEENYSLDFVGYMDRPMGPDLLKGNRFHLVVRHLTENELHSALHEIDCVKMDGYPNYFDDQRLGSFDARQGFIAEKILKKHYNGALKIYFSGIHPEDSKVEKEHRKFFYENWGNWKACLMGAKSKFEKETFGYLERNPKGFIPILQRISHEKMVLFFSAYQSHLWNEVLRKIIRSIGSNNFMLRNHKVEIDLSYTPSDPLRTDSQNNPVPHSEQGEESDLRFYRGIAGDYIFHTQLDDESKAYLGVLVIPMPASNIRMPDAFTKGLYAEVLKENNLKPALFNIRQIRQAFFKGIERKAIIKPEALSVEHAEDEIYQGKKKLILKFFLPRGCYGTMFIKRLFCSLNS